MFYVFAVQIKIKCISEKLTYINNKIKQYKHKIYGQTVLSVTLITPYKWIYELQ